MITAPCPRCGERNPADATQCVRCGTPLHGASSATGSGGGSSSLGTASRGLGTRPGAPTPASTYSASGDAVANYPMLRRLSSICALAGFASLLCGSLAAVAIFLRFGPPDLLPRLGIAVAAVLGGGFLYLALSVTAERIIVALDTEANTRRSARLLEDLVRRGRSV